ncbi:MAG: CDP-alcohol phosphatidyltransferase family protein [Myxococcota bacterium]|nr:CDP-alcohol phosphatidyltransferase family protein [Myxococcota bacterium]
MIKASFGDRLDAFLHKLFPFLFHRKQPLDPNRLTVVGAVVSLIAAWALATGEFFAAGFLILFGGFFDLVDGVVARHYGISTSFGAFLDSTLDRFVDMALFLGVVLFYASAGELGIATLAAFVLVASVLTSYAKARAETQIEVLEGGLFERGERVGLLAAGAILDLIPWALGLLAIGSAVTVAQRFSVAYRELERLDAARRASDVASSAADSSAGGASIAVADDSGAAQ